MRIRIMPDREQGLQLRQEMQACPTTLKVVGRRWLVEITDPEACAPTISKLAGIGPEARANLARHIETEDQDLGETIRTMRKRRPI